jgi:hypothetical protein
MPDDGATDGHAQQDDDDDLAAELDLGGAHVLGGAASGSDGMSDA